MPPTRSLDFPEMLGQMLYIDLFPEADVALLSRYRAGGVMVKRRYVKSTRQLVRLIARHQEQAVLPLLVGAAFEWGTGADTTSGTLFPGMMALAANRKAGAVRDYARTTAREARALGVNHVLMPVLDVSRSGNGYSECMRSPGGNADTAVSVGAEIINVFQANKVMATARHFPGNTANGGGNITKADVEPFSRAVKAGVLSVMVGHIPVASGNGGGIASLSEEVITRLLREKLGFNGLILTDNLALPHVNLEPVEACAAAIRAGADVLQTRHEVFRPDNFTDLLRVVEKDRKLVEKVKAASERICSAKDGLGLFKGERAVSQEDAESIVGAPEHLKIAKRVSLGAITVLRDNKRLLPLKPRKNEKVLIITPKLPDSPFVTLKDNWGQLYRAFKAVHDTTVPAYVSFVPTGMEVEKTLRTAARSDYVVVILTHEAGHQVDGAQAALANAAADANPRTVCAVLGNPFASRALSAKVGTVVLTFSNMPPSQEACAEVLLGKAKAAGRLPVEI